MSSCPKYRYKIHDKLYDLTEFVKIHPGGTDMFNNLRPDTNITPMLYLYHKNPKSILEILPKYEVPMPENIVIKYDTNYTYDTYCELKQQVYDEIHEKKIPLYWTNQELAYNIGMVSLYLTTHGYCMYNANHLSYWWIVLLAFMYTGIGNLIYHEVCHYCGVKNQAINQFLMLCTYPLMVEQNWKYIHNYSHHCFTNTDYDFDFAHPTQSIRHSEKHTHHWYNRLQSLYSLILFKLAFIHKGVYISIKQKTYNWTYVPVFLFFYGVNKTLVWYLLCGFMFAFVAQVSHIQHECVQINKERKNDFLYNQVSSSMNYRTDDPITRIFCFGLDIQIEHHLYPNIPHSSLRRIQHIVRNYCDKNDIPYVENPHFFHSMWSYLLYIYKLGNP